MDEGQLFSGWFWAAIAGASAIGAALKTPIEWVFRWIGGVRSHTDQSIKNHSDEVEADMSELRQHLADHKSKTEKHLAVIEGRLADNYNEFLRFQTEVAKHLATKEDLRDVEIRIKEHITRAVNGGHK